MAGTLCTLYIACHTHVWTACKTALFFVNAKIPVSWLKAQKGVEEKGCRRTLIPADEIYSSRHYVLTHQGAGTHIHQGQRILAFYSPYS